MSTESPPIESDASRLPESDILAIVEQTVREANSLDATRQLHKLAKHLYWKAKDLASCVALLRAAAQLGLTASEEDSARRYDLRSEAKGACYDIASFTWPGWDEAGISITESDTAVGYDAARTNLRLAAELNKGDLPRSRAHWMLAAQALALKRHEEAADHFRKGALLAAAGDSRSEQLLCEGFAALADLLARPHDGEPEGRARQAIADLEPLHEGAFFAEQIRTAARVFGRPLG